jgi:anti-anti-sigma regulatory factor
VRRRKLLGLTITQTTGVLLRNGLEVQKPIVIEELELELTGGPLVRLTGVLKTQSAQDELNRHLQSVQKRIVSERMSSFTVDVQRLSFVNSSAIRVFVNWASRAEAAGYKLVFLTDRETTWHRLSFSVLRSLAPGAVEIIEGSEDSSRVNP